MVGEQEGKSRPIPVLAVRVNQLTKKSNVGLSIPEFSWIGSYKMKILQHNISIVVIHATVYLAVLAVRTSTFPTPEVRTDIEHMLEKCHCISLDSSYSYPGLNSITEKHKYQETAVVFDTQKHVHVSRLLNSGVNTEHST